MDVKNEAENCCDAWGIAFPGQFFCHFHLSIKKRHRGRIGSDFLVQSTPVELRGDQCTWPGEEADWNKQLKWHGWIKTKTSKAVLMFLDRYFEIIPGYILDFGRIEVVLGLWATAERSQQITTGTSARWQRKRGLSLISLIAVRLIFICPKCSRFTSVNTDRRAF